MRAGRHISGLVWFFVALTPIASAQIFHAQGGSSSLMNAHGGSIGFDAPGYSGAFGAGFVNGRFEVGGVMHKDWKGYTLTTGDETLHYSFPTDVFESSYFLVGRGVGISKHTEKRSFSTFVGKNSDYLGAPYFQAAKGGSLFMAAFSDLQLSSRFSFQSRLIVGKKQTIINGLSFKPSAGTLFAVSGGIGANAPYFATAMKFERTKFDLKASYVGTNTSFRRASGSSQLVSEPDRDNEQFTYRFNRRGSVTIARQNLLAPVGLTDLESQRATVHQVSGNYSLFKVQLGAAVFQSRVGNGDNVGTAFRASRAINKRLEIGFDYNRNRFESSVNSSTSANLREQLTQRISAIQYVSHSGDQTSFSFGGELRFKRFDIAVTNDTAYAPFRTAQAGGPFVRVYNVHISLRPFRSLTLQAQSNVDPEGRVRYTGSVGDYFYRYAGLQGRAPAGGESELFKYVVIGRVVNMDDKPVAGAAVQIGTEMLFTNSDGEFLLRVRKRKVLSFRVSLRDFLTTDFYDVVAAPTQVEAEPEDQAKPVVIRLRKIDRITGLRMLAAAQDPSGGVSSSNDSKLAIPQE